MKKALLIGINYTGTDNELNGCINDVTNVKSLLIDKFGYLEKNIVMMTDDTIKKPTRVNIMEQLTNIALKSSNGDEIWIHYSGHGSYQTDTNSDETDGKDEGLVPLDFQKTGLILDDSIKAILKQLNPGAKCIVVLDCCHSGSCVDLPYFYVNDTDGIQMEKVNRNQVNADVMVISGCKDSQTSADAFINKKWAGALTFYFMKTLEDNKYTMQIGKLINEVRKRLAENGYDQYPILSTSRNINLNKFLCISKDDASFLRN